MTLSPGVLFDSFPNKMWQLASEWECFRVLFKLGLYAVYYVLDSMLENAVA